MRWMLGLLALSVCLAGCRRSNAPGPAPHVSYILERSWESADHAWFYPQERFNVSWTGLSAAQSCETDHPTADGEDCNPALPEAAIQSLQIPVILCVTNLENGLQILVRANDRGPASPSRVIALNDRARSMLGITDAVPARVRVEVETAPSEQLKSELDQTSTQAGVAAPLPEVAEKSLDQPNAEPNAQGGVAVSDPTVLSAIDLSALLTKQEVRRIPVSATELWVDAGQFSDRQAAQTVADDIGGVLSAEGTGRHLHLRVQAGPFTRVEDADAALNRARGRGITGARIVVE